MRPSFHGEAASLLDGCQQLVVQLVLVLVGRNFSPVTAGYVGGRRNEETREGGGDEGRRRDGGGATREGRGEKGRMGRQKINGYLGFGVDCS